MQRTYQFLLTIAGLLSGQVLVMSLAFLLAWGVVGNLLAEVDPIRFQTLAREEGVPGRVFATLQDRDGFIWFATSAGLCKYDGHGVMIFRPDEDGERPYQKFVVKYLAQDRDGFLWMSENRDGLRRFDPATETFERYGEGALSNSDVLAIHCDDGDRIWIGTRNGLNQLDPVTGQCEHYLNGLMIKAIEPTHQNSDRLWIGTTNGKLFLFNSSNGSQRSFDLPKKNGDGLIPIDVLHQTSSGELWVGSKDTAHGGLFEFDPSAGRFMRSFRQSEQADSLSYSRVSAIHEDREGQLWVGTMEGGLNRFHGATSTFTHYQSNPVDRLSLSNNRVNHLFEDRDGLLWVGTEGGGVSLFDPTRPWQTYYSFSPSGDAEAVFGRVVDIHEDGDGGLWLAHTRGLIHQSSVGEWTTHVHDPNEPGSLTASSLRSLHIDRYKNLWIGGETDLCRWDRTTGKFTSYRLHAAERDPIPTKSFMAIEESDGRMWIGTKAGLYSYEAKSDSFVAHPEPKEIEGTSSNRQIQHMLADRDGALWMGMWRDGLRRRDPVSGDMTQYRHDPADPRSLSSDSITALFEDSQGNLWVGTRVGLNLYDRTTQSFRKFLKHDGSLVSDDIHEILEDDSGSLWLGTSDGLTQMNNPRGPRPTFRVLQQLSGNYLGGVMGAWKVGKHQLLFGVERRVYSLCPDHFELARPATIKLTNLRIAGQHVPIGANPLSPLSKTITHTDELILTRKDRMISFEFASLDYRSPGRNRYSYKLEGYDAHWSPVVRENQVTYTNLSPGAYTFMVKGGSDHGLWNDIPASVRVVMKPEWWERLAFRLLLGGGGLGLIFGINHLRIKRVRRHAARMREEIKSRTQAQHALQQSESQLRLVANSVPVMIAFIDAEKRYQFNNRAYQELVGKTQEELLGQTIEDVLGQNAYAAIQDQVERVLEGRVMRFEQFLSLRNGEERCLAAIFTPHFSEADRVAGFFALIRDVTEQRASEAFERHRKDEMAHYSRVATLGEIAGALAHEINQPLASMRLNSQVIRRIMESPDPDFELMRETVDEVIADNKRASEVVERIRRLLKKDSSLHKPIDVNALIADTAKLLRSEMIIRELAVDLDLADRLPPVSGDNVQLQQVVLNLLLNARDAILDQVESGKNHIGVTTRYDSGSGCVLISVEDTGEGIAYDDVMDVFEPFNTTKDDGMGLGLAISKSIIEVHGGSISVESEPNVLTTFTISLRACEPENSLSDHGNRNEHLENLTS